jgi:zinc transport system ATP-binding protein
MINKEPNSMTKKIVAVANVSVRYGDNLVLSDVSFSINERDVVVIIGPNGAGKSTLLRALLGLIPFEGTVTWNTDKIGYIPPQESLLRKDLPPLTLFDFFHLKNKNNQDISSIINEIGLSDCLLTQQLSTLSTGQFQRAMLAWTLIDEPSLLILDEPTSGIDIGGEETVYSLLHRIWQKGNLTIVLVSHSMSVVWKHATNVLCINKKLICYGSPEESLNPEILQKLYGTEVSVYEHRHTV